MSLNDINKAGEIFIDYYRGEGYSIKSKSILSENYIGEDLSHHVCYIIERKSDRYTIELHKTLPFLSPMLLQPIWEEAIMVDDQTYVTNLLDTFCISCNHIWNYFPYSLQDFYFSPCILRLFVDVNESYKKVKKTGLSDEKIYSRAKQLCSIDIVGNGLKWTKMLSDPI